MALSSTRINATSSGRRCTSSASSSTRIVCTQTLGRSPPSDSCRHRKTPCSSRNFEELLRTWRHSRQHTATLRDLLKKDAEFAWTPSHKNAFQKTKDVICKEVTLSYFDPAAETVVQVDASSRGVGAVLLQHDKPIAFASKSLSECERRYANIEREMLAVVFGCERFHTFVYGKRFTVESDHKPLEMIHLKNLSAAPQRLQRMLLRIQPYDIGASSTSPEKKSQSPTYCQDSRAVTMKVSILKCR